MCKTKPCRFCSDVIVNVNTASVHETTVVTNLIEYLKDLNKKQQYPLMHEIMNKIFKDKMSDPSFLSWLASKLNIRTSRFFIYVANWRDHSFKETRGTANSIDDELKQEIFDTLVENSINSTDGCNGRNLVSISKSKYNELFDNIENKMVCTKLIEWFLHALFVIFKKSCLIRDIQFLLVKLLA